ncbi:hypothetical protein RhiirA4_488276 [Rhizophagus irregularis]|uniref:Uncharacterized protein n=1 Tax=Rhizophagus irregularis TaxID=588596 RepID=A0A2I1HTJ3_9GLOM|nr:hypothetical protein RhiirA4_488276 [Rhizophagus irregularis]
MLTNLQPSMEWDDWIRKLLRYADEMGEKTQNVKTARKRWYDDRLYIEENLNPPPDAPKWVISTTYQPE